jgi:hypothetical protein
VKPDGTPLLSAIYFCPEGQGAFDAGRHHGKIANTLIEKKKP